MAQPVVRATSPEYSRKRLVVAIAIGGSITSLALGTRATYGLFLDPVVETIGTGRAPFSLAIAVQAIVWGLAQPVAGQSRTGLGQLASFRTRRTASCPVPRPQP